LGQGVKYWLTKRELFGEFWNEFGKDIFSKTLCKIKIYNVFKRTTPAGGVRIKKAFHNQVKGLTLPE